MTAGINRNTTWQAEFEDIRCYHNSEISAVLKRLTGDIHFLRVLVELLHPHIDVNQTLPSLRELVEKDLGELDNISSVESLQAWITERIFPIVAKSYENLSISGSENIDPSSAYVFISNHRDILMDPMLLNLVLISIGAPTANLAIGDNLLSHQVANDLARLNRCFMVKRSITSPKAILNAMKVQSAYIQHLHFIENENIWIAQKEGRSKDNSDTTNPALIKMLALSRAKSKEAGDYLNELNIVPVSFSYEWDPCDVDKAMELELQSSESLYEKGSRDDLIAVNKGLGGFKGNIGIHFGKVITSCGEHKQAHKEIADKLDQDIQNNYKLYPVNYSAYKKLNRTLPHNCPFDKIEINKAYKQLETRIEGQTDSIKKRVYKAYASPIN